MGPFDVKHCINVTHYVQLEQWDTHLWPEGPQSHLLPSSISLYIEDYIDFCVIVLIL